MLPRLIGEDIEYVFLPDPKLAAVKADPGQIEQVLMNLVVNSRDAMPNGGTITVRTRNVVIDKEEAEQRVADVARRLRAAVGLRHRHGHVR